MSRDISHRVTFVDLDVAIDAFAARNYSTEPMPFVKNDGGRKDAGYRGSAGDCVARAIAIAEDRSYKEVYAELAEYHADWTGGPKSARNGVNIFAYRRYLIDRGWKHTGCVGLNKRPVRLRASDLPCGVVICELPKHLCTVVDHILHDTWDCSKGGKVMVEGYWTREE